MTLGYRALLLAPLMLLVAGLAAAEPASSSLASLDTRSSILKMLLGLGIVLGLIFLCAWVFKRFGGIQATGQQMKVQSVLNLGTREKAVLVDVQGQRLLLGVAPGRVSLLHSFDKTPSDSFDSQLNQTVAENQAESESARD